MIQHQLEYASGSGFTPSLCGMHEWRPSAGRFAAFFLNTTQGKGGATWLILLQNCKRIAASGNASWLLRVISPGKSDGIQGSKTRAASAQWIKDAASIRQKLDSLDERSERQISTLIPHAQRAARQWLFLAREEVAPRGYDVRIICGTCTWAEQDALARQVLRVTRARGGQSFHNFGIAWDFGIF